MTIPNPIRRETARLALMIAFCISVNRSRANLPDGSAEDNLVVEG